MEDFEYDPCVQKIMAETTKKLVTQMHVKDSLESLNINKTTGWDGIPGKVLKIGAKELARPLMTLFNSLINSREWPSEWKCG